MQQNDGLHVAIIMDGNGRWARRRRRPRQAGHRAGAAAVRGVVETAAEPAFGIDVLTLYAFSSDNWQRPSDEVRHLMRLLEDYLAKETPRCIENGIRLMVTGRRDRLSGALRRRIEEAESATAGGERLTLRLAIDYSARDVIVRAAGMAAGRESAGAMLSREEFGVLLGRAEHGGERVRDVDLLVRTGGERRLSDFLLWECAYAELYFTDLLWPDFGAGELAAALADYRGRERRFGRVLEEAV